MMRRKNSRSAVKNIQYCRKQRCALWYMNVRVDKILVFVCWEKYHESKDGIDNEECL